MIEAKRVKEGANKKKLSRENEIERRREDEKKLKLNRKINL